MSDSPTIFEPRWCNACQARTRQATAATGPTSRKIWLCLACQTVCTPPVQLRMTTPAADCVEYETPP